jgi:hypothetical protein
MQVHEHDIPLACCGLGGCLDLREAGDQGMVSKACT